MKILSSVKINERTAVMLKIFLKAVRRAVCDILVLSMLVTILPTAIGRIFPESGAEKLSVVSLENDDDCMTLNICNIPIKLSETGRKAVEALSKLFNQSNECTAAENVDIPASSITGKNSVPCG